MNVRLRKLVQTVGVPGLLGLAILVACAAFYRLNIVPAQSALEARRAAVEQTRKNPSAVSPLLRHEQELRKFRESFPPLANLADQLELMHALAARANVRVQQTEFRLEADPSGLAAYRISLPVRGRYSEIRTFVSGVLKQLPTASIDRLRFQREKIASTEIEAQLRLTFYFRADESTKPPASNRDEVIPGA